MANKRSYDFNEPKPSTIAAWTCSLVGIILVSLKLLGYVSWSWIWVLSPYWLPVALTVSFLAMTFLVMLCVSIRK